MNCYNMETIKITREEALRRLKISKQRRKERLMEMEEDLRRDMLERTGQAPKYFRVW